MTEVYLGPPDDVGRCNTPGQETSVSLLVFITLKPSPRSPDTGELQTVE
jgi:hypothetical protein